jgi:hypothetical protein
MPVAVSRTAEAPGGDLPSTAGRYALGLVVGDPSGLSFVAHLGGPFALQLLVGWDLLSPGGPTAAADLLFLSAEARPIGIPLDLYAGIGVKGTFLAGDGRFGDSSADYGYGLRLPLGLRTSFAPLPVECVLEIDPGFRIYPKFAFDPDVEIGARILF